MAASCPQARPERRVGAVAGRQGRRSPRRRQRAGCLARRAPAFTPCLNQAGAWCPPPRLLRSPQLAAARTPAGHLAVHPDVLEPRRARQLRTRGRSLRRRRSSCPRPRTRPLYTPRSGATPRRAPPERSRPPGHPGLRCSLDSSSIQPPREGASCAARAGSHTRRSKAGGRGQVVLRGRGPEPADCSCDGRHHAPGLTLGDARDQFVHPDHFLPSGSAAAPFISSGKKIRSCLRQRATFRSYRS